MKPYYHNGQLIRSMGAPFGYTPEGVAIGLITEEQADQIQTDLNNATPKWDLWRASIIGMPAYSRVASNPALSPVLALSIQFERWAEAKGVWDMLVLSNPLTPEEVTTFNSISNANNVPITLNTNGTMNISNV